LMDFCIHASFLYSNFVEIEEIFALQIESYSW